MPHPVANPPNPWQAAHVDWEGEPPPAALKVYAEEARSVLSENQSPDLGFRYSLNPYRGCYHGCTYCYARPTHQYWGWGAGTDFERHIVVKTNAVRKLREALARRSWKGERIVFSGNTDCYQPLEAAYRLTRGCLEVCSEHAQPVTVITKSAIIERDVELLAALAAVSPLVVVFSIPFPQQSVARALEPFASPVEKRFQAMRRLSEAGVTTGISIAPLVPGLNESDVPSLLGRARSAGARHAMMALLRLPRETVSFFEERLRAELPLRAERILSALAELRDGRVSDNRFGHRMVGRGARWQLVEQLFRKHCSRLGLATEFPADTSTFRRPKGQLSLFYEP